MAPVVFTAAAIEDLRRLGPVLAPRVLRRLATLGREPDAGAPFIDPAIGLRRLVVDGGWRVVYETTPSAVTVWELWRDSARSDGEAYAEALEAMQSAGTPELVQLARILRRLGRITGTVPVARARVREPVPDWLAEALVARAGVDPLTVAAMDAASAFDAWNSSATDRVG
jgi:mRNA interferase RelE/StbE